MPPACENRSRVSGVARMHGNVGSHVRPRRVVCTASPGRMRGLAKAVSTFGHFSDIRESITQKTERKQQVDGLPFRTFALDTQQPRNQVPKS